MGIHEALIQKNKITFFIENTLYYQLHCCIVKHVHLQFVFQANIKYKSVITSEYLFQKVFNTKISILIVVCHVKLFLMNLNHEI